MKVFSENHLTNLLYVLEEYEQCKLSSFIDPSGDVLCIDGEHTRLYVKIVNNVLCVSYVVLNNRRIGTFSKIICMLNSISQELHLDKLMIENVSTSEMENFCKKNNFMRIKSNNKCVIYSKDVL